eukprot:6446529-Amphidinium_carterae.1
MRATGRGAESSTLSSEAVWDTTNWLASSLSSRSCHVPPKMWHVALPTKFVVLFKLQFAVSSDFATLIRLRMKRRQINPGLFHQPGWRVIDLDKLPLCVLAAFW